MSKTNKLVLIFILKPITLLFNYLAMTPLSFMLFVSVSFLAVTFINVSSPFETSLNANPYLSSLSFSIDETDILHYFLITNAVILSIKQLFLRKENFDRSKRLFKHTTLILITSLYLLATLSALSPIARPGAQNTLGILFLFWIIGMIMSLLYTFLMSLSRALDKTIEKSFQ